MANLLTESLSLQPYLPTELAGLCTHKPKQRALAQKQAHLYAGPQDLSGPECLPDQCVCQRSYTSYDCRGPMIQIETTAVVVLSTAILKAKRSNAQLSHCT